MFLDTLNTNNCIDEDTKEVDDIPVTVYQYISPHSNKISQVLYTHNATYTRKGYKVIEYERWTETTWYDWEEIQE